MKLELKDLSAKNFQKIFPRMNRAAYFKFICYVFIFFVWPVTCLLAEVRVAVYGSGVNGAMTALGKDGGIKASKIENLRCLSTFDVIIFSSTITLLNDNEDDAILKIMNFVHCGGGVLFTHAACGRWGVFREPIFPQVCYGVVDVSDKMEMKLVNKEHPALKNVREVFSCGFNDHLIIKNGPRGTVLIRDDCNEVVVVAGLPFEGSDGRVVFMGTLPLSGTPGGEMELLTSAVKWLGSGKKTSIQLDDNTRTRFMQERKQMLANFEKERNGNIDIDYEKLPKGHFQRKAMFQEGFVFPGIYTQAGVKMYIAHLKHLGINVLLFSAYDQGYALFLSKNPEAEILLPYRELQFDPLKAICEEAHRHKIQVLALIHPFHSTYDYASKHLEFLQVWHGLGAKLGEDQSEETLKTMNMPWLCPDRPEVRERAKKIIGEIIKNYDVDGISLDYIRYANGRSCSCPYSLKEQQRYQQKNSTLNGNAATLQYCRESILSFISEIKVMMEKTRDGLMLHGYTHPDYMNQIPWTYHSKRVSSAQWDLKLNRPDTLAWETLGQIFRGCKKYESWAHRFFKTTAFCPLVDIGGKKPVERFRKEIRTVAAAGVNNIAIWGAGYGQWFMRKNKVYIDTLSEELGGLTEGLQWEDPRPHVPAKPNLLPNSAFAINSPNCSLPNGIILERGQMPQVQDDGKYGKRSLLLDENGLLRWKERIPVNGGRYHSLSAWVKIIQKTRESDLVLMVSYYDATDKKLYSNVAILPDDEFLQDWQRFEFNRPAPFGSKYAIIHVRWRGIKCLLNAVKFEEYPVASGYE